MILKNVVGYFDIVVGCKFDLGLKLFWKEFYEVGIGVWYDDVICDCYCEGFECDGLLLCVDLLEVFCLYGYVLLVMVDDVYFVSLLCVFQMYFCLENYDGVLDVEMVVIFYVLNEKYLV